MLQSIKNTTRVRARARASVCNHHTQTHTLWCVNHKRSNTQIKCVKREWVRGCQSCRCVVALIWRVCVEKESDCRKKMMDQKKAAFTHFLFVYLLGGTHPHETKCHVTIASGTTKKNKIARNPWYNIYSRECRRWNTNKTQEWHTHDRKKTTKTESADCLMVYLPCWMGFFRTHPCRWLV